MSTSLVTERIAARAAASPDAAAVSTPDESITYAELMLRADNVARYLLAGRVAAGDLVGVCLDRGPALVIALLGVLRAGCGYLPLDPEYPVARLLFMLQDSGATAVLSTPAKLTGMPIDSALVVDLAEAEADPPPAQALPAISAGDLAYVIYTSGSTGTPKGVAVEHGNVARLFDVVHEHIPVSRRDVWTWFHSVAFDFSVWEIWGALVSGGHLVVVSVEQAKDPDEFLALVRQSQATILSQTPSAFARLLGCTGSERPRWAVRAVVLGGEAVSVDALARILSGAPGAWPRVYNLYGITETTVHATVKELTSGDLTAGVRSPIGTPLSDLRVAVLDQDQRPVPSGAPGELWIGGAGVARGYVGRPDLTAERFRTGLAPGPDTLRWYRSGDLVRQLPSGELEYIGRIDRQVKIRGFRIELGEIEAALTAHPAVLAAAVEPREGAGQADRQLDAFVVASTPAELTSDEIREWLASRLPGYMVPSAFLRVDSMPLTPNGKIDRDALRRLTDSPLRRRLAADEPLTAIEAKLRSIWSELLGVTSIRGDDSFFAIGGDSMLALRVVSACKDAGIGLAIRDIYTSPTLAGLAAAVDSNPRGSGSGTGTGTGQAGSGTVLAPAGAARPMPGDAELLIPANQMQCGVLFEAERFSYVGAYHVVSAVRVTSPRNVSRGDVLAALEQVASDNIALRTSFDLVSYARPMQVVHRSVTVQLSYDDLSGTDDDEQDSHIRDAFSAEDKRRFRKNDYPLWRVACVQTSPHAVEVMLAHHHAILDGWSVACFFDQLTAALSGNPYQRAPAGIHEAALRLETSAVCSPQDREFWRAEASSWQPLPIQRTAAQARDSQPASSHLGLDTALRKAIREASASWGCSPKHLHLAAHLRAMASYARWADHAATGLIVNARPEEPGADRALGMFLNLVPFSVGHVGESWSELAREVRAAEARLQPYRWFPLAKMISELAMAPVNVWFNYTDFSATAMRSFLRRVHEVSPTAMPLTVSVADDGLIVEASAAYFSAEQCAQLAASHLLNLEDAVRSGES